MTTTTSPVCTSSPPIESPRPGCDLCGVLGEEGGTPHAPASAFCIECGVSVCEQCAKRHRVPKSTRFHQLVGLKEKPGTAELVQQAALHCPDHPKEEVRYYCYDCEAAACSSCSEARHEGHARSDTRQSAEQLIDRLRGSLRTVNEGAEDCKAKRGDLDAEKSRLSRLVAAAEDAVLARCDQMRRLVDERQGALLGELRAVGERRAGEIGARRGALEELGGAMEQWGARCQGVIDQGAEGVETEAAELNDKAEELLKTHASIKSKNLGFLDITFTSSDVGGGANSMEAVLQNLMGRISVNENSLPGQTNQGSSFQLRRLARLQTTDTVCSVAQLRNKIYVVICESVVLRVYDAINFEPLDDVTLTKASGIDDIAACLRSDCLYASDSSQNCIWRLKDDGRSLDKWLETNLQFLTAAISVTSDGRVVLLSDKPARLVIYAPDASLTSTIALPADMEELDHAVETTNGNFVVSHGRSFRTLHRVCLIGKDGRVLRTFGGQKGGGEGRLDRPENLAVDEEARVYVADNLRVMVLDANLSLIKVLLTRDGDEDVNRPWGLSSDAESARVMVGYETFVDVYSCNKDK